MSGDERTFDFVNAYKAFRPEDERERRRQVRVLAMRAVRQRQREERLQHDAQASPSTSDADLSSPASLPRGTETRESRQSSIASSEQASPAQQVSGEPQSGSSSLPFDPFGADALELPVSLRDLVDHFSAEVRPQARPSSAQHCEDPWACQWMDHALTSAALLTAVCCRAATHLDHLQRQSVGRVALELREHLLNQLSRDIEASPTVPSRAAIGAVVMLLENALLTDDAAEVNTHTRALGQMYRLRDASDARALADLFRVSLER